jgi:hypothetical protein
MELFVLELSFSYFDDDTVITVYTYYMGRCNDVQRKNKNKYKGTFEGA